MQSNKEVAMQSNMPFVSIIINCFNGEKYIGDAINFALRQTYPDFELIIWDNQSTDNTLSVIKTFHDPRINYCYAPEHTTLARARNNAVECAKGAWIAFLDCDDIWLPEKLFLQVAVIKAAPCSLSIVYGRYTVTSSVDNSDENDKTNDDEYDADDSFQGNNLKSMNSYRGSHTKKLVDKSKYD